MTRAATDAALSPGAAMNSRDAVAAFFDRYRRHDIEGMLTLFAPDATLDYVPIGVTGRADVQGKAIWAALLDAFPDLHNEVDAIHADDAGRHATAEVTIGGTQVREFAGIQNRGRTFSLRHAFVFEFDTDGRIERLAAYWDNVRLFEDLGKTTLG
ncbi:nuclear transport factor 2 family protein [Burkholderia cepacia]|nr:nuclear transport factor 2 family protein [Burkholderia cepacia]MCA7980449.1 nuclear transport factor 2 family protein [Burkholderia cepacia]MCA8283396.1 nuclear transport factor 2 family protein [Burkholderia cepacia]MCE4129342.1 nuclear transport factor 2 family protein [Burkholderia cepacia]